MRMQHGKSGEGSGREWRPKYDAYRCGVHWIRKQSKNQVMGEAKQWVREQRTISEHRHEECLEHHYH